MIVVKTIHQKFGQFQNAKTDLRWLIPSDLDLTQFDHGDVLVDDAKILKGRLSNQLFSTDLVAYECDLDPFPKVFNCLTVQTVHQFIEVLFEGRLGIPPLIAVGFDVRLNPRRLLE